MTTIRVAKRRRFTTVDRQAVNDKRLSYRARGVLFWLLDKPDDWATDSRSIAKEGTEGRDAIRTALSELTDCGYLRQTKERDPKTGQFKTETLVFEVPEEAAADEATPGPENPTRPLVGKPGPGNPAPDIQALKTEDCPPKTETETSSAADAAARPLNDPLKRAAHRLTVLAMEQQVKPVLRSNGNPFPAVMAIFEQLLRARHSDKEIEAAIVAGIEVWTIAGVQTAIAHARNRPRKAQQTDARRHIADRVRRGA